MGNLIFDWQKDEC